MYETGNFWLRITGEKRWLQGSGFYGSSFPRIEPILVLDHGTNSGGGGGSTKEPQERGVVVPGIEPDGDSEC